MTKKQDPLENLDEFWRERLDREDGPICTLIKDIRNAIFDEDD